MVNKKLDSKNKNLRSVINESSKLRNNKLSTSGRINSGFSQISRLSTASTLYVYF